MAGPPRSAPGSETRRIESIWAVSLAGLGGPLLVVGGAGFVLYELGAEAAAASGLRRWMMVAGGVAMLLLWLATRLRRPWPRGIAIGLLAFALALLGAPQAALAGVVLATLTVAGDGEAVYVVAFALVAALAYEIALRLTSGLPAVRVIAADFLILLAAAVLRRAVGQILRDRARLHQLLNERETTEAARLEAVAARARAEERERLAREIHDVLAHTLSAIAVQLQALQLVLAKEGNQAAVAQAEHVYRLAYHGLEEAQQAVLALRGEGAPGTDRLRELCTSFESDTRCRCSFRIEGLPLTLTPEAKLAIFRVTQEALTNVRKHAPEGDVNVILRYSGDSAQLVIANQGSPRLRTLPRGGFGLTGMRERAELLGGSLIAGPTADGFRVELTVPADGVQKS
ncbi:MAG: sensor histidine kinase [Candidatus Dormibacteraceae bacterium]